MDGENVDLYFIKNKDGQEIDFLVTREKQPYQLVEVKWKDASLSQNFKRFLAEQSLKRVQVVGTIEEAKSFPGGERIEPAKDFLAGITQS